jgi:GDP-L-fucose synthase
VGEHVIPELVKKFSVAKLHSTEVIELLGTGRSVRDFLHVSDLGAAVNALISYRGKEQVVNVNGSGAISISDLASYIAQIVGFRGEIVFNRPDLNGADFKVLDGSFIQSLGWRPKVSLLDGLNMVFEQTLV